MSWQRRVNDLVLAVARWERRIDPLVRPAFDRLLRGPLVALVQAFILWRRPDEGLALAEERLLPGEGRATEEILAQMSRYVLREYPPGTAQRAGNTKTHGVVRATLQVHDGLPPRLRQGLFARPATYPAWVRFAGPGPSSPPDIEESGILSIGVKIMGVPGPKLWDDERFTQDFTGISAPTFTTPDVITNVSLQRHVYAGTPLFHFLHGHLADLFMQALYARTHTSPLETPYWSCVPYLFGEGQAVQFSFVPRPGGPRSRVPWRPSPNYLREAMSRTLAERPVDFDVRVQLQVDARRMPIEDASVVWPERLSPPVTVATLHIERQRFDSPEQLAFADVLSFNPWHCLPEHRPLGNQNRARRAIYLELSRLRQSLNSVTHIEPTGDEVFPSPPGPRGRRPTAPPPAAPPEPHAPGAP